MSGIGDQGLRPPNVEPAPVDEEPSETDERRTDTEQEPSTEDLQEPSTEKEPGEEPKAPEKTQEPQPSHEAVGIGVIGRPQTESDETSER
jgi:hypothetical protein